MKGIIKCEESQVITKAFRNKGHEFYSNDIQECSGGHPEWHKQCDGLTIPDDEYDFVGCHPVCTFLTNSGVRWLYNKDGTKNIQRWIDLEHAVNFFNKMKSTIKKGYLENPIPHKYARDGFYSEISGEWVTGIGQYQQLIQPYQFGHPERKATCLWLINLNPLIHTNNVKKIMDSLPKNEQQKIFYMAPSDDRAKLRSKTFQGIADAMANQWC
jgi:hypothetical protein